MIDNTKHARLEFNDQSFGIGAGKMSNTEANDDDLYLWSYNGAGRDIRFMSTADATTDVSNWSNNMIIKGQTGYVGIGTTNPDSKLTVKGTIHATEVLVD